jgi:Ca-activated chloride channel family protein
MTGAGEFVRSIDLRQTKVTKEKGALPYLWARNRLAHLLDFNPDSSDEEIAAEVVSLGLTYHLLTPHTAFVAVDETVRNPNDPAEDVKQPSPMPKGVSNLAVGGGHNVPEPGLMLMVTLLCLFVFGKRLSFKIRKVQQFWR